MGDRIGDRDELRDDIVRRLTNSIIQKIRTTRALLTKNNIC